MIDKLCDTSDADSVVVACVYCDFREHEQSATGLLASLLRQLVAGVEPIPRAIKEAFDKAKSQMDGRALRLHEICAIIKSISSLRRGFICIDALDEFPGKYRPDLWDSLKYIIEECSNVRLFITGRPHIREEAERYLSGYPDIPFIQPTKEDIKGYLVMRLRKDLNPYAMDKGLEADILTVIPNKISGAYVKSLNSVSKVTS